MRGKTWIVLFIGVVCLLVFCLLVLSGLADRAGEEPEAQDAAAKTFSAIDLQGEQFANSFREANVPDRLSLDLSFLNEFAGANRPLLLRHLATSAKWFVGRDRGKMFACRRAIKSGRWVNSLHGYVFGSNGDATVRENLYQYRVLLGLDGPIWADPWLRQGKATVVQTATQPIDLKGKYDVREQQGFESYLVIQSRGAAAEIFEQSGKPSRPFTLTALAELRKEFDAVLASATAKRRGFDPSLVPADSVKRGPAELKLVNDGTPGYYQTYAYVNPGESGFVHLKASGAGLADRFTVFDYISSDGEGSEEYAGWSADPQETFFCNTAFSCSQHLLSKHFSLRLELWFTPDSGRPERKLIDKVFHVQEAND